MILAAFQPLLANLLVPVHIDLTLPASEGQAMLEILLVHPAGDRLQHVVEDMRKLGPPEVFVYLFSKNFAVALEGTHRLTAAEILGYKPILKYFDQSDNDLIADEFLPDEGFTKSKTTIFEMVKPILEAHGYNKESPRVRFDKYSLVRVVPKRSPKAKTKVKMKAKAKAKAKSRKN